MPDTLRFPKAVATALLAALALSSCRDASDGERFAFDGKLVVFNYRVATATFLVNLKHLRRAGEGEVAFASFEDPAGGAPIVVREKIWPNVSKTTITTPPLKCIVKDRPYKISIAIRDAKGDELQRLETTITSSEDQSLLPEKPLVVGPLYTPNPELANKSGVAELPEERCPGS
jgi:hypothetical protein